MEESQNVRPDLVAAAKKRLDGRHVDAFEACIKAFGDKMEQCRDAIP